MNGLPLPPTEADAWRRRCQRRRAAIIEETNAKHAYDMLVQEFYQQFKDYQMFNGDGEVQHVELTSLLSKARTRRRSKRSSFSRRAAARRSTRR